MSLMIPSIFRPILCGIQVWKSVKLSSSILLAYKNCYTQKCLVSHKYDTQNVEIKTRWGFFQAKVANRFCGGVMGCMESTNSWGCNSTSF